MRALRGALQVLQGSPQHVQDPSRRPTRPGKATQAGARDGNGEPRSLVRSCLDRCDRPGPSPVRQRFSNAFVTKSKKRASTALSPAHYHSNSRDATCVLESGQHRRAHRPDSPRNLQWGRRNSPTHRVEVVVIVTSEPPLPSFLSSFPSPILHTQTAAARGAAAKWADSALLASACAVAGHGSST